MSSVARSRREQTSAQPRVLLAMDDPVELSALSEALTLNGHAVSVARSEQDLLLLLLAVEAGSMPEPDAVALEARLLGPPALRALRALRAALPRVGVVFLAPGEDRASRVLAAHLGGQLSAGTAWSQEIAAAAAKAASGRIHTAEAEESGPPSGVRKNGEQRHPGKDRAGS